MRVLFVTHKWGDAVPNSGESVTIPHLVETFREWGKGECSVVWTDECFHQGHDLAGEIKASIGRFDPDYIAYTPIPAPTLEVQNVAPKLMRSFGKKAISFFFDLADDNARRLSEKYAAASHLCVNIDGSRRKIGRNFLSLWPTRTKRTPLPKNIEVSFVGARANYADRMAALDLLHRAEIPILVSGGRSEEIRSFDEYFDILDRSRITLNFSKTIRGVSQIKARVFEALSCGCCLVEDRNEVTERYLTPGVDYVVWDELRRLPELLRNLLKDSSYVSQIAERGRQTFEFKYSASCFWNSIAEALQRKSFWSFK